MYFIQDAVLFFSYQAARMSYMCFMCFYLFTISYFTWVGILKQAIKSFILMAVATHFINLESDF